MNNTRRKRIQEAIDKLAEVKELVESIQEEEQECYDNLPESLQEGDKGCAMSDAIDNLGSCVDDLESAADSLEEAMV